MIRQPEMNLHESAVPWGRSVEDRLGSVEGQLGYQISADGGEAASLRASADSVSEQLGELVAVMGISQYEIPAFNVSYSSIPIGGEARLLNSPTWNFNIASRVEVISAILNLQVSDSSGSSLGPRAGNMLFRVGPQTAIFQGQYSQDHRPLPRAVMQTVDAVHPLPISVGFRQTGTGSGTLSATGVLTLVLYGR